MSSSKFATVNELLLVAAETRPQPDAFQFKQAGRYRPVSSAECLRQVAAFASALSRLGVKRGDRVAILAENRLEWAFTDYAVLGLGAADVPIYPSLLEHDIEFILSNSGSKGVVVSTEAQLGKIASIRARLPLLEFVIIMDEAAAAGAQALSWHGLVESELRQAGDRLGWFRQVALQAGPEDMSTLLYTSGTTGEAKGVVLTHANIASVVRSAERLFSMGPGDVSITVLPLSHIYERILDYYALWRGVSIAYPESIETLPENMLELRPTLLAVVPRLLEKIHEKVFETVHAAPPLVERLFHWALDVCRRFFPYKLEGKAAPFGLWLKHAIADALVCSRVRARLGGRMREFLSGSAPLSREIAEFFFAMGMPVYEGYGSTETTTLVSLNHPGAVKIGTVGQPLEGVEVKLGEEFTDEDGSKGREILVRGPNITPGYYRLEEENRVAFAGGWFHTGDLGEIDSDGFLLITGRKKNLFKTSGGKYVAPEKLENLFQTHPWVSQILVIGDARKFVSALIVPNFPRLEAYAGSQGIVFRGGEELIADPRIQAFIQQQVDDATRALPPHERIHQIGLVAREFSISSGELSPTHKIKRRVVEANYHDLIEEIYRRPAPQLVAGGR